MEMSQDYEFPLWKIPDIRADQMSQKETPHGDEPLASPFMSISMSTDFRLWLHPLLGFDREWHFLLHRS